MYYFFIKDSLNMMNDDLGMDELSTEEKTRFSNNLRELNKSKINNGNIISTSTINSNSIEETKKFVINIYQKLS
jgi:hypothetical protein